MIDKSLIKGKIKNIEGYISEMENILVLDTMAILSNTEKIRTLERSFQLAVDAMLDINMHIISELELKSPDDFQSTFRIISSQKKILSEEFAEKIAPVVGLRNKLVHQYEEVKPKFFVEQVKKEYKDFVKYLDIINQYLNKI